MATGASNGPIRAATRRLCGDEMMAMLKREGLDSVEGAFAFQGGSDLAKPGLGHRDRRSLSLADDGGTIRTFFMKRYGREPLSWRVRRMLSHGPGRSPAGVEMDNVAALLDAGVPSIPEAFCGEEFDRSPYGQAGHRRSYIILAGVPGRSLEKSAHEFLAASEAAPTVIEEFTDRLAELVRKLHAAGLVHRDLYASHIFLHQQGGRIELYLIDLARMFCPRLRKRRWRVKDAAQLKYSMPPGWIDGWWDRFLGAYLAGASPRAIRAWDAAIDRKVRIIRRHAERSICEKHD